MATTELGPLLRSALGQRVPFIARVSHFSTKRHWSGLTQATIVLTNIRFEANGAQVLESQTFTRGVWDADLYPGYEIAFEGLCPFAIDNRPGIVVACDTPDGRRRSGARVTVDWFA